jgi:predicted  nucleic acid-binding Zn-ribbon protein
MRDSPPLQPRDIPEIEAEVRSYVRQESSRQQADRDSSREQAGTDSRAVGTNIPDLIQRVAGGSVAEIDRLIAELTQLRDHLQREGKRVETEIAAFAQTGTAAASSIKEISQTLGRFKRAARLNAGE